MLMKNNVSDTATSQDNPFLYYSNDRIILVDNLERDIIMPDDEKHRHQNNPYMQNLAITVFVCAEGQVDVSIGYENYCLKENDAIFIKSSVVCEMKDMPCDTRFFSVTFSEEFFSPSLGSSVSAVIQNSIIKNPVCHLDPAHTLECITVYKVIRQRLAASADEILLGEILKGYLHSIVFNIYSDFISNAETESRNSRKTGKKQELYSQFLEIVRRDYRSHRDIKYYATQLSVTPRYLSQVVYAESGHFAGEHIDRLVITEAKRMIASRQYSIQHVSEELHFASLSFFGHYFKKMTGYAPSKFEEIARQAR